MIAESRLIQLAGPDAKKVTPDVTGAGNED